VEDDAVLDLDLAGVEVALAVRAVVARVPEAEFERREEREVGLLAAFVGHTNAPDLELLAERDVVERLGLLSARAAAIVVYDSPWRHS